MSLTGSKSRIGAGMLLFGSVLGVITMLFTPGSSQVDDPWRYFPSNLQENEQQTNEKLALISRGAGLTYTPAVFLLKPDPGKDYIDIQIWDAPTHEENQSKNVDFVRNGIQEMDILVRGSFKVGCLMNGEELKIDDEDNLLRLNSESSTCEGTPLFKKNTDKNNKDEGWSETIRIYPSGETAEIVTVWDELDPGETISTVPNTFNIFSLRSQNGSITVKPTDFNNSLRLISVDGLQDPSVRPEPVRGIWDRMQTSSINVLQPGEYKTIADKIYFDSSINWVTPYAIGPSATFAFDLDVSGLPEAGELIIFDKDGDASELHGVGNPPDPGIKMKVTWKDSGDLLTPWSHLNQEKYDKANVPMTGFYSPNETNAYQGPSGDLNADPYGGVSIQWYKFPITDRAAKGNFVRVEWTGSSSESNFFGFATNVPMSSSDSQTPPADTTLSCPPPGYVDVAFRETTLIKVNEDFEPTKRLTFEEWDAAKKKGDTKSEPAEYRIYGVKMGSTVTDAVTGKVYQVKEDTSHAAITTPDGESSAKVGYIDLEVDPDTHPAADKAPVARIKVEDIQISLLRTDANTKSPPRFPETPKKPLTDSQRNVRGVMISHNLTRQKIPKHIQAKIEATGREVQYYEGGEATMDLLEVQSWGGGGSETRYNEFVDLVVSLPCSDSQPGVDPDEFRVNHGLHTVMETNVENGKRESSCKYSDSKIDRDGIRYNMTWWDKDTQNKDHLGCEGKYQDSQYIQNDASPKRGKDRTNFSLEDHAVQFLPRVRPASDTALILFGKIRGSEEPIGDELEFTLDSVPRHRTVVCNPNPPPDPPSTPPPVPCTGKEIDYLFTLRNVGTKTLTDVTLHISDPEMTEKHRDQPMIKVPLMASLPVSDDETEDTSVNYKVSLKVPSTTTAATISTKGKFFVSAKELGGEANKIEPDKVICHMIGKGDPTKEEECNEGHEPPEPPICTVDSKGALKDCCTENSTLEICVDSVPPPETDQLRKKGITSITYTAKIRNIGTESLTGVGLQFSPPDFTTTSAPGLSQKSGSLAVNASFSTDLKVDIDKDTVKNSVISTLNKITAVIESSPEKNLIAPTIRHYMDESPNGPKCAANTEKTLEACIHSTPPNETKQMNKGDTIKYHVVLTNIGTTALSDLVIQFQAPTKTTLDPSLVGVMVLADSSDPSGTSSQGYTGIPPGLLSVTGTLEPGKSADEKTFVVMIDRDVPEHYTISTSERIYAGVRSKPTSVKLPQQRHHVGNGSEAIKLTRCYDYEGLGVPDCSDTCKDVPLGVEMIVMDEITNIGGETLPLDYSYYPRPLPKAFEFQPGTVRAAQDSKNLENRLNSMYGNMGLEDLKEVTNDDTQFPPPGGEVSLPFEVGSGKVAQVFYKYKTPSAPGCNPTDDEKANPPTPEHEYTPIDEYTGDCEEGDNPEDLCPEFVIGPDLGWEFTATPSPDGVPGVVYRKTRITYSLKLTSKNNDPVTSLTIDGPSTIAQTECEEGCADATPDLGGELQTIGSQYTHYQLFAVTDDAEGPTIIHPGYTVKYKGIHEGEETKEKILKIPAMTHELEIVEDNPNDFFHEISLSRTTVLNSKGVEEGKTEDPGREDEADISKITHVMGWKGTKAKDQKKSHVYPYTLSGNLPKRETVEYGSHCTDDGPTNYNAYFTAISGISTPTARVYHDASRGEQIVIYRSQPSTKSEVTFFEEIMDDPLVASDDNDKKIQFTIVTDLPQTRPAFKNKSFELNGTRGSITQDKIVYELDGRNVDRGISETNFFMLYGGMINDRGELYSELESTVIEPTAMPQTIIRAVKDGETDGDKIGMIETTNTGVVWEETWEYVKDPKRYVPGPVIACYRSYKCGTRTCYRRQNVQTYRLFWRRVGAAKIVMNPGFRSSDREYITVLTSVAWLKTMRGHLGFGTGIWPTSGKLGDPNYVALDDESLAVDFKLYSPPNQHNADMMIFAPKSMHDKVTTRLKNGYVDTTAFPNQGFIPNPRKEGEWTVSRGEVYDRPNNPRDYHDDLINRELFGRVVKLHEINQGDVTSDWPKGLDRIPGTDTYVATGKLVLQADKVYYLKGVLRFGPETVESVDEATTVIIDGGKARLFVDGSAQINANLKYSNHGGNGQMVGVPSVRLHTMENIYIHPNVTAVELMMLAENEFHSGRNDKQLRILGDVIAYKSFWERQPLRDKQGEEENINKPSELVIEDWRKYLLTPPGDKKLPDVGHIWREVNVSTGRPILGCFVNDDYCEERYKIRK